MPFITKLGAVAARAYGWLASVAQAVVSSDAYFYLVSMLLPGNGTNGQTNSTFLDSSTNNFSITRNGNTTQGTFSPFSQTEWSNYFDGTGDYLNTGSVSNLSFGTGDFTIEFWAYPTTGANNGAFQISDTIGGLKASALNSIALNIFTTNAVTVYLVNTTYTTGTNRLPFNTWTHLAIVRSSGVSRLYINGILETSIGTAGAITDTTSYTGTYLAVGGYYSTAYLWNGYISNFRVVKGIALYLTNFVPSNVPLTAVPGTAVLTCQDATFVDNSAGRLTLTRNGDASAQPFSPFTPSNFTTLSYSGYFDGSGDCLTVANSAVFTLGTQDHTVEFWMNMAGAQSANSTKWRYATAATQQATNDYYFSAGSTGGGTYQLLVGSSGAWGVNISAGATYYTNSLNTWVHVAWTRSGSTWRLFWNGQLVGTATYSGSIAAQGSAMVIGAYSSAAAEPTTGLISNFRMVIGTALYTSNFTPPTAPLTAVSNTSLLTCQNATFIDNSTNAFTITANGNAQPVVTNPFQTPSPNPISYSGYFDGSGDSLSLAGNAAFAFGTGDFTVECWIYSLSTTSAIFDTRAAVSSVTPYIFSDAAGVKYYVNGVAVITGSVLATNTWVHIAVVRSSGVSKLYINGAQSGSNYTDTNNFSLTNTVYVGNTYNSAVQATGYISNFRVVKGTAVYTANFIPPTAPLTAISGTSLLTCQNNRFVDNSSNAFAITINGNTIPVTASPYGYETPISSTAYSGYFDGTGDYLTLPSNAAFAFGTGDFTIEGWFYFSGTISTYQRPWWFGDDNDNLEISTSVFRVGGATQGTLITGATAAQQTWYHIAVTRASGSYRLFINGVQSGSTASNSYNSSARTFTIMATSTGTGPSTGLVSNLRIVKGTALYTSNFTPSTTPLTAVSGTSLLTCQNFGRFIDNSSNAFTVTVNGNTVTTSVNPFGYSAPATPTSVSYSALTNGGSGYFDGSGDYLSLASNAAFAIGTNDFTLEAWVYPTTSGTTRTIISSGTTANMYEMYINTSNQLAFVIQTIATYASTGLVNANCWTHVAVTRSANTVRMFVNGASVFTPTTAANSLAQTGLGIGSQPAGANLLTGYIANSRILIGTAAYTSSFAPPLLPPTAVTNTQLLLNYTNAGVINVASKNNFETLGTVQISTAQSKWGGSSIYFPGGSGNYVNISNAAVVMPSGAGTAFTLECWVYIISIGTAVTITRGSANNTIDFTIQATGIIKVDEVGVGNVCQSAAGAIAAGAWTHVALTRTTGNIYTIYVDGVSKATSAAYTASMAANVTLGYNAFNQGYNFYGYIDDFRVSRFLRYTANFTPPTAAFPTQ